MMDQEKMNEATGVNEEVNAPPAAVAGHSRSGGNTLKPEVEQLVNKMEVQKDDLQRKRKENGAKLMKTKGEMFQGTLDPISIFPEEIWKMILERVSSLERLATCRTNSQLDTAFGECKNEWLLDQVLPFLLKHFTEKTHLLKCRQVCKNWKRTVNTFLESEHPCRRPYQKEHPLEQLFCCIPSLYSNLSRCELQYLKFNPKSTHKFSSYPDPTEPLVGRAFSLQIHGLDGDQEINQFWDLARAFLEIQGGALWHFQFDLFSVHFTATRFYQILRECLKLLPNLRTLAIHCIERFGDNVYFINDEELAQIIADNPLPVLPRLHSLYMDLVPRAIQQHVISQFNSQLKRLSIDLDMSIVESNLQNDLVEIFVYRDGTMFEDFLRRLITMNNQSIPRSCQKLTLNLFSCQRVSGLELMQVLGQYPQLNCLKLILNSYFRQVYECAGGSSVVPSVEYIEIEGNNRDLFEFSTLLYKFPNLKYLHIQELPFPVYDEDEIVRKDVSSEAAKEEIEQYLYSHKLEESPIWDTLEHLEVLTFDSRNLRRFCNREQVKYYRERMGTCDKKFKHN